MSGATLVWKVLQLLHVKKKHYYTLFTLWIWWQVIKIVGPPSWGVDINSAWVILAASADSLWNQNLYWITLLISSHQLIKVMQQYFVKMKDIKSHLNLNLLCGQYYRNIHVLLVGKIVANSSTISFKICQFVCHYQLNRSQN